MAQGLLRAALGPGCPIGSAGIGAQPGYAPHPIAVNLMAERGIDITAWRSCRATPEMILAADLILVMERDQKRWCEAMAPAARDRTHLLGCWLPPDRQEVPDPMGQERKAFIQVFAQILEAVETWLPRLNPLRDLP
jgi:protein-tyrosine phosphatase